MLDTVQRDAPRRAAPRTEHFPIAMLLSLSARGDDAAMTRRDSELSHLTRRCTSKARASLYTTSSRRALRDQLGEQADVFYPLRLSYRE